MKEILGELNEQIKRTDEELNWKEGYYKDKPASGIDAFRIKRNQKIIMKTLAVLLNNL